MRWVTSASQPASLGLLPTYLVVEEEAERSVSSMELMAAARAPAVPALMPVDAPAAATALMSEAAVAWLPPLSWLWKPRPTDRAISQSPT